MSAGDVQSEVNVLIPPRLLESADHIKTTGKSESKKVRELLAMFGAQRRGYQIVNQIDDALAALGIKTEPYFQWAWIDGEVDFLPADLSAGAAAIIEEADSLVSAVGTSVGASDGNQWRSDVSYWKIVRGESTNYFGEARRQYQVCGYANAQE